MSRRTPSTVDAAFADHRVRRKASSGLKETHRPCPPVGAALSTAPLDDATIRTAVSTIIQTNSTVHPIYGPVERWDTSQVTDMSKLFNGALQFNADLSRWDTSKVTTMRYMFGNAEAFNSDLSGWDTSQVVDMMGLFAGATSFNRDLSRWNTSAVQEMSNMFGGAEQFQGDVSSWDTSHVNNMTSMFLNASSFNGDLSYWDTSAVTRMALMFSNATRFNSNLEHWNVSEVITMQSMFEGATSFKSDLSRWDTSNVVNMSRIFKDAVSFDSDLSYWDTEFLSHKRDMFTGATSFNGALSTRTASAQDREQWNDEGREFRNKARAKTSTTVPVLSEEQARVLLWSQAWDTFYDTRVAATRTLFDRLRGEGRLCVGELDLAGYPFSENTKEMRRMGTVFRLDSGQCISRYDVQLLLDRDDARVDKVLAPYAANPGPVERLTDVEKLGIGFLWARSYSDEGDKSSMIGEWPPENKMTPPMDGWPDLVSMANNKNYVAQWYRVHKTLRFQPYTDGDEREKPTPQELKERVQWAQNKDSAQERLRQEVESIVRDSEQRSRMSKQEEIPSPRVPTPSLEIAQLVAPPAPLRPRSVTASEATTSLLDEQEDDARRRGNAVDETVLAQINLNASSYQLRIEHFGQKPKPEAEGETVLRFASRPFRTAVNAMFGVPYTSDGQTKHCISEEIKSPGDGGDFGNANVVYKPVAIYEIRNTWASSEYRHEMRKARIANCSYRQQPVDCLTDDKFTGLMADSQGGKIDSGAPVNDKVLLHATHPDAVSSILLNGLSDQFNAKFGSRYGKGIYFADIVCKNVRYSKPTSTTVDIDQLLNLTTSESSRVRYMFIYRVTLGCAARYGNNMFSEQWESFRSTTADHRPIYQPNTSGNEWKRPFTSLVINSFQNPQEHILKNRDSARMLPVGLVAYEKTYQSSERAMGRVSQWW